MEKVLIGFSLGVFFCTAVATWEAVSDRNSNTCHPHRYVDTIHMDGAVYSVCRNKTNLMFVKEQP